MEKYENSSQSQRSRSNVTNFQTLLAFTMGHIRTKLHQFLSSSFRDFVQTDGQTDGHRPNQYLLAACAQVIKYFTADGMVNGDSNRRSVRVHGRFYYGPAA